MVTSCCTTTTCVYGRTCVPSIGKIPVPSGLMFICEAPGYRELEDMEPLVGPAGRLHSSFLQAAGISRADVALVNTCGCVDLNREDRRPLPVEIEACRPRLLADIERFDPKVIISMGNISQLLFFPGMTVSKVRGKIRNWNGRLVIASYHPAYALPHRSPQVAPIIVEDIKSALTLALTLAREV